MYRNKSEGIIYKILQYSDNSAVAFAFTKDFGKIKLFIQKAFSKSGGISKMIPGEIDFVKKEKSDLHKFYNFYQNTEYSIFHYNPNIFFRLNMIFEILDIFYPVEEEDRKLWNFILKISDDNFRKSVIYIINYILGRNGFSLGNDRCSICGIDNIIEYAGESGGVCRQCDVVKTSVSKGELAVITAMSESSIYKNLVVDEKLEKRILALFEKITFFQSGIHLRSLNAVIDILE